MGRETKGGLGSGRDKGRGRGETREGGYFRNMIGIISIFTADVPSVQVVGVREETGKERWKGREGEADAFQTAEIERV